MKDAAEKKQPETVEVIDEKDVTSFASFLKDKGIEVKYVKKTDGADKKPYDHDIDVCTKELLSKEMLINGVKTTPAKYIAQGVVAYVMDNPSPMNVGQLRKNIGDDVVNVNVGGMGIEDFLESVAPKDKNDEQ